MCIIVFSTATPAEYSGPFVGLFLRPFFVTDSEIFADGDDDDDCGEMTRVQTFLFYLYTVSVDDVIQETIYTYVYTYVRTSKTNVRDHLH